MTAGNKLRGAAPAEAAFDEVVKLIQTARVRAAEAVNVEVIDLYWRIGEYLHHRIAADGWAKGTVVQLAAYIATREPGRRGFSAQNLWRMRQFYEAWRAEPKLSTLLRVLPWSSHLHILSRAKRPGEREFYLRMASQNRWPVREVGRQIDAGLFEQAVLNPPKLSTALRASPAPVGARRSRRNDGLPPLLGEGWGGGLGLARRPPSRPSPSGGRSLSRRRCRGFVSCETQLPDKQMLAAKLHEFYALNALATDPDA